MGEIARVGISRGKRVESARILPRTGAVFESFVEKCFRELGCSHLIRPILEGEPLTVEQAYYLLQDAPISLLMKVIEAVVGSADSIQLPRPLVGLPIGAWTARSSYPEASDVALKFLRALPFSELDVFIDTVDFEHVERLLESMEDLARRRPGVRLIGPSVEEMVSCLVMDRKLDRNAALRSLAIDLDDLLFALKRAGFYRLRFSHDIDMALELDLSARLRDAGFVSVFGSAIERAGGTAALAKELSEMGSDESGLGDWDVWLPSLNNSFEGISTKSSFVDVRILRLLAVGTLCLKNVPVRRVSSGYLSLDGLTMARHFGANDLGYGSLDAESTSHLKLSPYKTLIQVLSK